MTILHIDFETRSTVDLKVAGLDNYARHESTDVWCAAYALDSWGDTPPELWAPSYDGERIDHGCPEVIRKHVEAGCTVVAHNAPFELAIWNHIMAPRYGWPELKPEQVQCTMAMAYAMSLPGALEKAAPALGIEQRKDLAGGRVMLQLARPREIVNGKPVWWDDPKKLEILYAYCKQDVEVERALHKRMLALSPAEKALWLLDYRVNARGVAVDRDTVRSAIAVVDAEQSRLDREMRDVTNNAVATCSAVGQLGDWIAYRGVKMPGVAKADVLDALAGDDLPADVRKALRLRQEAAKTSTAKLDKMVETASSDGRLRGMFQYHGAGTGRWAARKVQLHNLPRPKIEQPQIEQVIDILGRSYSPAHKARLIEMLHGAPLDIIASCLRGMLWAAPGHELIAGDFVNIEGRGIAWLAGEEWKLKAFMDADAGRAPDIYIQTYARAFGLDPATISKKDPRRQQGKVMELAFGYQGGVGAWKTMCKTYPDVPEMSEAQIDDIKTRWREAHPAIVNYWYALERAATEAVLCPGHVYEAGPDGRQVLFRVKGSFLWCKLPSGRNLCYPYPKLKARETPWGEVKDQVHYMTVDGVTGKWEETHTYGGKLAENITQAISRDILAHAMTELDKRHYDIVLHIHDEAVIEVPADAKPSTQDNIKRIMEIVPAWATGFPIKVDVWRGARYRKG